MSALNTKALEEACRLVARNTMWNTPHPMGISDIVTSDEVEAVVREYLNFATEIARNVEEVEGDPNLVVRAVEYLAGRAIPPMKDDLRWFRESLGTITELACPEVTGGGPAYSPIHDDLLYAIAAARKTDA